MVNKSVQIEKENDSQLLKRLAAHDETALTMLYTQHYPMIRQMVVQNNGQEADAQDIFQEALIILLGKCKLDNFILHCKLKTYLYSVCWHLWLKKLDSRKLQAFLTEDIDIIPAGEDIEELEKKDHQYDMMHIALSKLGEPCQTILKDYYLRRKSMQDIAGKFGYTNADNAKNQKYKCLLRLKKLFFAQYKNI